MAKLKDLFFKKSSKNKIIDREYLIGKYKVVLKGTHMLDNYQKSFPLYDRFLPLFCSSFEGLIIDIGANIGDTSIAVFSKNEKSFIVGVEPDESFYDECINNIKLNNLSDRFLGIKKFILTDKGNFSIEKDNTSSTGSISYKNDQTEESNAISFSELMNTIPTENKIKFDILKIDTDGFDWSIIDSFYEYTLNKMIKPRFVFFEMQTFLNNDNLKNKQRDEMLQKYMLSLERLNQSGYNNFCLFDNYGTHIKITNSIEEIKIINDYIARSQIHNSHSTIYYMDVLAFSDNEINFVKESLDNLYNHIS
jgi:FkbM family methyltransferase